MVLSRPPLCRCLRHADPPLRLLFTPVLKEGDVLKVDFGVHVNGRIVSRPVFSPLATQALLPRSLDLTQPCSFVFYRSTRPSPSPLSRRTMSSSRQSRRRPRPVSGSVNLLSVSLSFDTMTDAFLHLSQVAGIDVRMCDIGREIQEVMESYEVTVGSNTKRGKPLLSLSLSSLSSRLLRGGRLTRLLPNVQSRRSRT